MIYVYEFRKDGAEEKSIQVESAEGVKDAWRQLARDLGRPGEIGWVMENYHFLAKHPLICFPRPNH